MSASASSLFVSANHMLLLYCVLYAVGDFLRAFFFESDTSSSAVAVSVVFWLLSLWLLVNSVIYYKAFMAEMEAFRGGRAGTAAPEGTGIVAANAEVAHAQAQAQAGALSGAITHGDSSDGSQLQGSLPTPARADESLSTTWRRWTFWLSTETGMAYALNILGSLGYVVSSMISLFITLEAVETAREVDRASLFLDSINMIVFIVDGILFWHVWWKESDQLQPSTRAKIGNIYFWANVCNTFSSIFYFAFICWSLHQRYVLARDESKHVAAGESEWYDDQLIDVTFKQRTMYFVADLIYLIYAILLEIGWRREKGGMHMDNLQNRVQLKEVAAESDA